MKVQFLCWSYVKLNWIQWISTCGDATTELLWLMCFRITFSMCWICAQSETSPCSVVHALSCISDAWSAVGNYTCQLVLSSCLIWYAYEFCCWPVLCTHWRLVHSPDCDAVTIRTHYDNNSHSHHCFVLTLRMLLLSTLRPLTHAPEIGAITSVPDSGTSFSCQCTTSKVMDWLRAPKAVDDVISLVSAREPGAGIWCRI